VRGDPDGRRRQRVALPMGDGDSATLSRLIAEARELRGAPEGWAPAGGARPRGSPSPQSRRRSTRWCARRTRRCHCSGQGRWRRRRLRPPHYEQGRGEARRGDQLSKTTIITTIWRLLLHFLHIHETNAQVLPLYLTRTYISRRILHGVGAHVGPVDALYALEVCVSAAYVGAARLHGGGRERAVCVVPSMEDAAAEMRSVRCISVIHVCEVLCAVRCAR
jgi:hypothetical protein